MFHQRTAVYNSIVKAHDNEFAFLGLHNAAHRAHELAGCIRQAKWQGSPLIQPKFSGEGRLLPVGCCDTNLMIASRQVQSCEPAGAVH